LYEKETDWTNARKYYERAANKKDPLGMYNLAIVLGNHFGQGDKGCILLQEALTIKTIEPDVKKEVEDSIKIGCVARPTSSPTPTTSSVIPTPSDKASPNATALSTSAPVAKNVVISSLFGNPWQPDPTVWNIPITDLKSQTVPPVTGVQFRLVGYPNAGWIGVPYQLKQSNGTGGVWAQVNAFLFAFLFKDLESDPCPEFRLIQEKNGEIIRIWSKSIPECNYSN
jgi:hypothetical protein